MKSKDRKHEEKRKEEILSALPAFINQLLLLMNSGMVLQEAMIKIAVNYKKIGERKENNIFISEYIKIYDNSEKTGESIIKVFCRFGNDSRVKELSRIAGILKDGGQRGTDLWNSLADAGEGLWEERKRSVTEKIKLSESKMSFPLGILLLALITITAAPAMLQMYI